MPRRFSSYGFKYNRKDPIPGVTGKRINKGGRIRTRGGFPTQIPFIAKPQGGSAAFREYHRQQVRDVHGRFAGGIGFALVGLEAADARLYDFGDEKNRDVRQAMQALRKEIEAHMKANAPWNDRTPDDRTRQGDPPEYGARDKLFATFTDAGGQRYSIVIGHGQEIYYGIWLETRWGGRLAILAPTIEHFRGIVGGRLRAGPGG